MSDIFLSTFPLRGTSGSGVSVAENAVISIHVPLAGNVDGTARGERAVSISIHVPLAGNVSPPASPFPLTSYFYPRSPCGERPCLYSLDLPTVSFLSTFPLRGTSPSLRLSSHFLFIFLSTVPLRGTSSWEMARPPAAPAFLSTFPLRGTSASGNNLRQGIVIFLSTFPLRGTSVRHWRALACAAISIHVPLAGNVYVLTVSIDKLHEISIHVPLAGNVLCRLYGPKPKVQDFYPRSPCGERLSVGRREL